MYACFKSARARTTGEDEMRSAVLQLLLEHRGVNTRVYFNSIVEQCCCYFTVARVWAVLVIVYFCDLLEEYIWLLLKLTRCLVKVSLFMDLYKVSPKFLFCCKIQLRSYFSINAQIMRMAKWLNVLKYLCGEIFSKKYL